MCAVPISGAPVVSDEETQEHFDDFFEDVFVELEDKYGEIDEMNVCDNLGKFIVRCVRSINLAFNCIELIKRLLIIRFSHRRSSSWQCLR